ncbi:MAG: hypothetical protein EZS28_006178 [Streblomastix strix]|uniref:Uncharacterized protein n=1 Tax=Streblomastix strix TaxID=222440 RepID=A0A5J4WTD8_9EUKA|nr:MAG: hypothetical protein EZS28_006178 [Streblomastix strix]
MESLAFMVMERIRQAREYQQKPNIKKLINGSDNKKIENTDEKSPIEYLLRVSTEKDREMIYKKANEAIEWIEENDGTPQMTLSAVNNLFDDLHKTIDPVFVRAEQCRIFDAVMKDARIRVANTTRVAESIREKMNIRLNKHKSEQMEHEAHLLEQKKQREQQKINQEMDNNQQGLDIEGWGDDEQKDNGIENIDNGKKLNDDLNIISEEQHTTENELDLELISDVEDASNYLSRWLDAAQLKHDTASPLEDPPVTVNDVINVINEMADMVRQSMTRDMERRAEFAERERQTLEARLQMEREILQNQISPGKDIQKDAQELNTDKSKLKKQKNELNQENSGPEL